MAGKKNNVNMEKEIKPEPVQQTQTPSKADNDSQLLAAIAWIISFLGIIIYFMKKEDRFVKFHALQSTIFGVAMIVLLFGIGFVAVIMDMIVPLIGGILSCVTMLLLLLWLIVDVAGAYKAYNGKRHKFPIIGDLAEKNSG